MTSYTVTEASTFSITHARDIAAKVATDLKRLQRLYCEPSDTWIAAYEREVVELLKGGYLEKVTYGYWRGGNWIEPTLIYTARELADDTASNDDPGKIRPGRDITRASFYSYLIYSSAWIALSQAEKHGVNSSVGFTRGSATQPGINGYTMQDRTYSAGGRALDRASVRSFS